MYQVAAAIRELGTRDWFDYATVIAPLFLSVVAIWISISTARKQNKIAILNLRYEAIHTLALVFSYSELLVKCNNSIKTAQIAFNANFGVSIDFSDRVAAVQQMYIALRNIEKNILVIEYVFPRQKMKAVSEILEHFKRYMEQLVLNEFSVTEAQKLNELCVSIKKDQYRKMERQTYLCKR